MTILDRGKMKWLGFMMPEHTKLLGEMPKDYERQNKPIIDEYQIEEFESKIHLAMEFAYTIRIVVWEGGFNQEYKGIIHRLDDINKVIYVEQVEGYLNKIAFQNIVGVDVDEL